MSSIAIQIPHQLPKEEAKQRIQKLLSNLKEEQKDTITQVKEEWVEDKGTFSFTAMGFDVSGTLQVNPDHVAITGDLPFVLSFFKDKISGIIEEKATALLA
jgi:Putative polyhydroxyalkanoic acid system protein (PHA_gran_rgn).